MKTGDIAMTKPCICPVCKGSGPQRFDPLMPLTYLHELAEEKRPLLASTEPVAILARPKPQKDKGSTARDFSDMDSHIRYIESRTDISSGMKAMQIKNVKRKYGVLS